MSTNHCPLTLFAGVGVELEYMIVRADNLDVLPIADELIRQTIGTYSSDVLRGTMAWSNELALHLIELKTNGPSTTLDGLPRRFQSEVHHVNEQLRPLGGQLMPTGMHPWMDPAKETRLWPHEYGEVYKTFDRLFDCRRHGWANLQSMHLNLPFADDEQFARLHAAIRLLLPLLPVLGASSPLLEGMPTESLDNRLQVYRVNSAKIPSLAGRVIPEPIFTQRDYDAGILQRIYRDIAPLDPEGVLQDEFLNARGAIARFSRQTIEIRVLDVQECPLADLAIAAATVAVLKALIEERWSDLEFQKSFSTEALESIFSNTIVEAGAALIDDRRYLEALGVKGGGCLSATAVWRYLLAQAPLPETPDRKRWLQSLELILDQGCLAHRILRALRGSVERSRLQEVYRRLCDCLANGCLFTG